MSMADAIQKARIAPGCKTGQWLATQDQESQIAFRSYLEDGAGSLRQLFKIAQAEGLPAGRWSFEQHAAGDCMCGKLAK